MRNPLIVLVFAAGLATSSCDEKLSTLAGPTPNLQPTFSSVQSQIFETTDVAGRQACVNCHTNVGHAPLGGLNLTHDVAYDQIVNVPAHERPALMYVTPGDPDSSYLVQKLEGLPGIAFKRMPFNGPPYLTDGQILILKRWIATGAPRN
jgi:hypothetical protein